MPCSCPNNIHILLFTHLTARLRQQVRGLKPASGASRGPGDSATTTMYDHQHQQPQQPQYDMYGQPLPQQGPPQPQLFEDTSGQTYSSYGNQGESSHSKYITTEMYMCTIFDYSLWLRIKL